MSRRAQRMQWLSTEVCFGSAQEAIKVRKFVLYFPFQTKLGGEICPSSAHLILEVTSIAGAPGGIVNRASNPRTRLNWQRGLSSTNGMDARYWHPHSIARSDLFC